MVRRGQGAAGNPEAPEDAIAGRAGKPQAARCSRGSAEGGQQVCDLWERSGQRAQSCPTGAESEGSVGWLLWSGTEQLTAVRHRFGCSSGASWRGWRCANDELGYWLSHLVVSGSELIEAGGLAHGVERQRNAGRQSSGSALPGGQVFRHRSGCGDDGCLAGRLVASFRQRADVRKPADTSPPTGAILKEWSRERNEGRSCPGCFVKERVISIELLYNVGWCSVLLF